MEIYGYIPITNCPNGIDKDKCLFEGKLLKNGRAVGTLTVRFFENASVPAGDPAIAGGTGTYSKYATQSTFVNLSVNDNLDITSNFTILYGSKSHNVPANTTTIINILHSTTEDNKVKEIVDDLVNDIKNIPVTEIPNITDYENIWDNYDKFKITNGSVQIEEEPSITGVPTKKYVWKGDFPLDKMIYAIQSNLDILMKNQQMKGDSYASSYTNLFNSALAHAVDLEKNRLSLYENARQFKIKTELEKYLSILKLKLESLGVLSNHANSALEVVVKRIQTKLYNTQTQGFKANNNNKLLAAQLDGASTAFSAGMTETVPPTNNNAELMSLYTQVKTDMGII